MKKKISYLLFLACTLISSAPYYLNAKKVNEKIVLTKHTFRGNKPKKKGFRLYGKSFKTIFPNHPYRKTTSRLIVFLSGGEKKDKLMYAIPSGKRDIVIKRRIKAIRKKIDDGYNKVEMYIVPQEAFPRDETYQGATLLHLVRGMLVNDSSSQKAFLYLTKNGEKNVLSIPRGESLRLTEVHNYAYPLEIAPFNSSHPYIETFNNSDATNEPMKNDSHQKALLYRDTDGKEQVAHIPEGGLLKLKDYKKAKKALAIAAFS